MTKSTSAIECVGDIAPVFAGPPATASIMRPPQSSDDEKVLRGNEPRSYLKVGSRRNGPKFESPTGLRPNLASLAALMDADCQMHAPASAPLQQGIVRGRITVERPSLTIATFKDARVPLYEGPHSQ